MKKSVKILLMSVSCISIAGSAIFTGFSKNSYEKKLKEYEDASSQFSQRESEYNSKRDEALVKGRDIKPASNSPYDITDTVLGYDGITLDAINVYSENEKGLAKVTTVTGVNDTANLQLADNQLLEYVISTTDEEGYIGYLKSVGVEFDDVTVAKFADKVTVRVKGGTE